jgi:alkylated DNA repair dioxygenase AlkB
VVSISVGDEATFLLGGQVRKDPVRRLELLSGDVIWFGGPSRLIFHGVAAAGGLELRSQSYGTLPREIEVLAGWT